MKKENKCICGKKGFYSSILGIVTCLECFNNVWDKAFEIIDDGVCINVKV